MYEVETAVAFEAILLLAFNEPVENIFTGFCSSRSTGGWIIVGVGTKLQNSIISRISTA